MQVSVIIPVYNAAAYVEQAVESALEQPETAEVVLVEDGSSDGSLAVCERLAAARDQVRLYRHPNGENRGAGASRNLAIEKSIYQYIAFLDADDYFLPGRFAVTKEVFADDPTLDGIYEAIGTHFEDEDAKREYYRFGEGSDLTTVTVRLSPEKLLVELVRGGHGSFSVDGLTLKRCVFDRTGLFDEGLRLHQDSVLIEKLLVAARLAPGVLNEPVAVRRVHGGNRYLAKQSFSRVYRNRAKAFGVLWEWGRTLEATQNKHLLLERSLRFVAYVRGDSNRPIVYGLKRWARLIMLALDYPGVILVGPYWNQFIPRPGAALKKLRGID